MGQGAKGRGIVNAMTVDVEDYFQVSVFGDTVSRGQWDALESRVARNTDRVLELFDVAHVTATFFILGWVAERHPELVVRIARAGHEVASHGHDHRVLFELTPEQFREDIRRSKSILESVSGRPVVGFRAPSFSVTRRTLWALDVLIEEGFEYDASIFPIHHDRYGIARSPRHPYQLRRKAGVLLELPGSTVRIAGLNVPVAGGGYFRILPYGWTRWGIRHVNRAERRPVIFYIHPWELDPEQPRLPAGRFSRFRHYRNLSRTESRLRRLVDDFSFGPLGPLLGQTTQHPLVDLEREPSPQEAQSDDASS